MILNLIRSVDWEGETLLASATTLEDLIERLREKNPSYGDDCTLEVLRNTGKSLVVIDLDRCEIPGHREFLGRSGPQDNDENWAAWTLKIKEELKNAVNKNPV